jgi:uncharacterized membrane protein YeaQ/YmgE (transglycosylase-associated protein family)
MNTSSTLGTPTERSVIWRNAVVAIVVTLVLNVVLYFVADAAGWIPDDLPERAEQFGLPAVIMYTIVPLLGAALLLSLLVRWTSHPVIMYSLIAAVVFIASLFAPLSIAGASTSFRTVLVLMHIIVAVIGSVILLRNVYDEPE